MTPDFRRLQDALGAMKDIPELARLRAEIEKAEAELAAFRQERMEREAAWKADVIARWQARAERRKAEVKLSPGKRKYTSNRPPENR